MAVRRSVFLAWLLLTCIAMVTGQGPVIVQQIPDQSASTPLNEVINLRTDFTHPDINENLILTVKQANGLPLPAGITLTMKAPTSTGSYDTPGYAQVITVVGTLAYVADRGSGLQIIDVSVPSAPTFVGTYNTPGSAYDITVVGSLAYVADGDSGLQIIDVSTPSAPTWVGNYNTPGRALGVTVVGSLAYVADDTSGLQIIDVSTPSAPTLLGSLDTPGEVFDITVVGTLAYVTNWGVGGLQIIDVSTPSAPTLLGSLDTPGQASGITVVGSLAYVADDTSGLQIIDVSTPSAPTLLGSLDTPDDAWGVTVAGTLAYVADRGSGLQIIDVSQWQLSGTPAVQGTYTLAVNVEDSQGRSAAYNFMLWTLVLTNPLQDQSSAVNAAFGFVVPSDTFTDPSDPTLDYSAQSVGGGSLPGWLTFTPSTRTFLGTPLSGDQGSYNIEVIATNDASNTASDQFILTVTNRDPTQDNALSNQALNVGATLNYVFAANTFSDGDGDSLTYTAELSGGGALPTWVTFTSGTRTFSGVPVSGDQGVVSIAVTASDGFGGNETGTFTLTVNNQAPMVQTPIGTLYATNGLLLEWAVPANTFNDADGDSLTLSAASNGGGSLPGWLGFNTDTLSGTPPSRGTHALQITANDGFGGQVTETFDLIIPNTSPVIANSYPNQDVALNTPFSLSLPANTFFDQDGDSLAYTALLAEGNPLPGWLSFTPGTLTFSGAAPLRESYPIAVLTEDGAGGNVTLLFTLRVANQAPTVENTIAAQNAPIGTLFQFAFASNTFNDDDGDELAYTARLSGGGSLPTWLSLTSSTRTFSGTPFSGNQGSVTIVVTADDSFGGQSSTSFGLTVPNDDPVLSNPIGDQRFNADTPFNWTVPSITFSDPDNDPFTYSAELQGGGSLPAWLSFNGNTGTLSGTIPASQSTPLMISITADDGFGGQASDTFELSVNLLPVLAGVIDNQAATVGNPFIYTFPANLFTEPDGDPLTYSATQTNASPLPSWITLDSGTRSFLGTPAGGDKGFLFVLLIASDPFGGAVSVSFAITVSDLSGNNPPLLAVAIPDQTANTGKLWAYTVPINTFDDPNDDPLTYSATLEGGSALPQWLTFDDQSRTFSGIPTTPEVIRMTVRVDDGRGGFALDTFTLAVQDITNQPPVLLNQLPNHNIKVGSNFRYTVPVDTFYDANEDALHYTATQAGDKPLPGWLSFDGVTRTFSGKPSSKDTKTYADRTHTIQVCVSDGEGRACSSFLLSVSGASEAQEVITVLIVLVSIASTAFGIYRNRAWLWNHLAKKYYQKSDRTVGVGQELSYRFNVPAEKIAEIRALKNSNPLPNGQRLPYWLGNDKADIASLLGTPPAAETITVCAYGYDGRILEAFKLIVKTDCSEEEGAEDSASQRKPPHRWVSLRKLGTERGTPLLDPSAESNA